MSSSSPLKGLVIGEIGQRGLKASSSSATAPFLKESHHQFLRINEYEELYNSEVEFLEHQKMETEETYRKWMWCYFILNICGILYSLGFTIAWFQWILGINSDDFVCVELKRSIGWIGIGYITGIFTQSASIVAAYTKAIVGFIIHEVVLFGLFICRVLLDVKIINIASKSLAGCSKIHVRNLNGYTYGTIGYCVLIITLFALTLKLLLNLQRIRKIKNFYESYRAKSQKQKLGYI